MSNSADYVAYTCGRVEKQVAKLNLTDLAADIASGEVDIEAALREAAQRGASTAQTFGAEQVRAAFDAYIWAIERGQVPVKAVKVRKTLAYNAELLRDKSIVVDTETSGI